MGELGADDPECAFHIRSDPAGFAPQAAHLSRYGGHSTPFAGISGGTGFEDHLVGLDIGARDGELTP
jgi:hypothetical protein